MDTVRIDKILTVVAIADGVVLLVLEILFKVPVVPIVFRFL